MKYVCAECGKEAEHDDAQQFTGRCPQCNGWVTIVTDAIESPDTSGTQKPSSKRKRWKLPKLGGQTDANATSWEQTLLGGAAGGGLAGMIAARAGGNIGSTAVLVLFISFVVPVHPWSRRFLAALAFALAACMAVAAKMGLNPH